MDFNYFIFFNNIISEVIRYKYLGILFTNAPNLFKENITQLRNKASRAIGDIRSNISKIIGMNKPYDVMVKLFDSQILPILEYGSEIWFPGKNLPCYEKIHLNFLKYVLGVIFFGYLWRDWTFSPFYETRGPCHKALA